MDVVQELNELRERQELLRRRVFTRRSAHTADDAAAKSTDNNVGTGDDTSQKGLASSIKQALATLLLNPEVDLPMDSKTLAKQVLRSPSVTKQAESEGTTLTKEAIEAAINEELEQLAMREVLEIETMAVAHARRLLVLSLDRPKLLHLYPLSSLSSGYAIKSCAFMLIKVMTRSNALIRDGLPLPSAAAVIANTNAPATHPIKRPRTDDKHEKESPDDRMADTQP